MKTASEMKNEYNRAWRKKNSERLKEYHKAWRKNNKDRIKVYQDRYWSKKAAIANGEIYEETKTPKEEAQ